MNQEEFEVIIADDTKEVSENVVWTDDQDHSPAQEFRVEVNSAIRAPHIHTMAGTTRCLESCPTP